MYVDNVGCATSLDESPTYGGEHSRQLSTPDKTYLMPQRRELLPVVHIRSRPILSYLGERKEQRQVWCLDHQNIVVRSCKVASARRHTASPGLGRVSPRSVPLSPYTSPKCTHSASLSRSGELPPPKAPFGRATPRQHHNRELSGSHRTSFLTPRRGTTPVTSSTQDTTASNSPVYITREEHFSFDFIHGEDASQSEVFEESVLDFVDMALLAQSITIICYGPTGSGKTYSMMGPTPASPVKKRGAGAQTMYNTNYFDNQQTVEVNGRNRAGNALEGVSMSQKSSGRKVTTTTPTTWESAEVTPTTPIQAALLQGTSTPLTIEKDDSQDQQQQQQQQRKHQQKYEQRGLSSPQRETDVGDVLGSPLSAHDSSLFSEFSQYMEGVNVSRHETSFNGIGNTFGESLNIAEEGGDTMGMLPRLVFVLLERRGETIVLDREDASFVASAGNSCSGGRDKKQEKQKQRHGAAYLTLRELMLYGVELYMDEYYDLLDPYKRPIPNVSDIGGLDAFCRKMNNPGVFTASSGNVGNGKKVTGASGSSSSSSFRGGGVRVSSVEDFRRCYKLASRNRVTKAHQRNDVSSRSHAVFILQLQFDLSDSRQSGGEAPVTQSVYSYVAMVDLAGSERVKETRVEGTALREAQYINKSLSALSAVLLALYQRSSHVPYRDSKLTRLLRPCMKSGHVLTLVHVMPCSAEETIGSLKFAEQVRHTSVQSHSLLNATTEVMALFEDLKDPHAEERMEAYRQAEVEYAKLCAEIRLAYLSQDPQDVSQQDSLSPTANSGETNSSLDWGSLINQKRNHVIRTLVERQLQGYRAMEEKRVQEAAAEIDREWEFYMESARRGRKQEIEDIKASIGELQVVNARLAEENSRPVLRDDYVMAIKEHLKELASEMTDYAKEKLLLREGMRTVNQRISLQADVERCLDEQLQKMQTVVGEGGGNSPRLSVDGHVDAEMGEIYHQQHLLSKEMSQLRKEATCFVRGDGIWEGIWARLMRQQLLLTISIDLEMLEGILLCPQSLRWVLETNGLASEAARNAVFPTYSVVSNVKTLLDTFETLKKQVASSSSRIAENDVRIAPFPPIPLLMSSGDGVRSAATLIGCYGDEAKMQEVGVKKLVEEGIFCEVTCLPISVEELVKRRVPAAELIQMTNYKAQWSCMRLVHPPKDTSSYSLDFFHRTYTGSDKLRDRRVISIPLDEAQLRIKLHVVEADGLIHTAAWDDDDASLAPTTAALPLLLLELQGIHPATNAAGTQQQHYHDGAAGGRSKGHAHYSGAPPAMDTRAAYKNIALLPNGVENAAASPAREVLLTKRLDCGGELLLPSGYMAACEEGSGCILLHFPERLVAKATRTEAVECIVAALSGLTLPLFPAASQGFSASDNEDTMIGDVRVVTYRHVPYLLLSTDGEPRRGGRAASVPVPRRVVDNDISNSMTSGNSGMVPHSLQSPHNRFFVPFSTACAMLNRLGTLTTSSSSEGNRSSGIISNNNNNNNNNGNGVENKDGNNVRSTENMDVMATMIRRMQKLFAFRKKTCAQVRQQIFDAEDIKTELLYSCSDNELLHGLHIRDVMKEARELIDLQQPQANSTRMLRGPVRATPGLCREMCGTAVPWTVWHWAHRWKSLQENYAYQQVLTGANDVDDDDDGDSVEEDVADSRGNFPNLNSLNTMRSNDGHALISFEELPCFLACME